LKALIQEEEQHGLRIAPLIDIVFLLIIFFLVATTFYETEKDITIRLAEASEGGERQAPTMIIVNVRQSGVVVVNERVKTLDELERMLVSARDRNPRVAVVVRCDKLAPHKHFVKVLNLCEKAAVKNVSVAVFQVDE
jgi:biopolymer transport protein ExbD